MEWTIQDLGAIGEFVSSFAVLATLVYLVLQMRQTQRMVLGQTRQAWADSTQDALLRMAESEHLVEIELKLEAAGFPDDPAAPETLSPVEHSRYRRYLIASYHRLRSHYYQHAQGLIDEVLAAPGDLWIRRLRGFGLDKQADELAALDQELRRA